VNSSPLKAIVAYCFVRSEASELLIAIKAYSEKKVTTVRQMMKDENATDVKSVLYGVPIITGVSKADNVSSVPMRPYFPMGVRAMHIAVTARSLFASFVRNESMAMRSAIGMSIRFWSRIMTFNASIGPANIR